MLGAWASILLASLAFFILPILLPVGMPSLRMQPYLLKTTDPAPLVVTYRATAGDVRARQAEIDSWDRLRAEGRAEGPRPAPLVGSQQFQKTCPLPRKSVFWTQGLEADEAGELRGRGRLSLELFALDWAGWNLAANPYPLNETVRLLIRTFVPFAFMVLFTYLGRPDESRRVKHFYAKMRVKVLADRDADQQELNRALASPESYRDRLLLPRSGWEFYKWNREDGFGFLLSVLAVGAVLLLVTILVSLGG